MCPSDKEKRKGKKQKERKKKGVFEIQIWEDTGSKTGKWNTVQQFVDRGPHTNRFYDKIYDSRVDLDEENTYRYRFKKRIIKQSIRKNFRKHKSENK